MEKRDGIVFGNLFEKLTLCYNGPREWEDEKKKEVSKVYMAGLMDLPIEQVKEAFGLAQRTCKWFPSVAEMRELVGCRVLEKGEDSEEAVRLKCEGIAYRLMMPTDGRPYNRAVLDEDPDIMAIFKKMGGAYKDDQGFGRWSPSIDHIKRGEFINLLTKLKRGKDVPTLGPSQEDSVALVNDRRLKALVIRPIVDDKNRRQNSA